MQKRVFGDVDFCFLVCDFMDSNSSELFIDNVSSVRECRLFFRRKNLGCLVFCVS